MENQAITVTMKLRPARKDDFYEAPKGYKNGVMYFVLQSNGKTFDPWPYYLSKDTDKEELSTYHSKKQLFVPVRLFDECHVEFTNPEQSLKTA